MRVPDIGDFEQVPVIEVLVKAGDRVKKNDSLITLESEKASMEVPAESDGVVQDVKVKVGDKVSHGTPILVLSSDAETAPKPARRRMHPARRRRRRGKPSGATLEVRVPDIGDFKDVPVIEMLVKPGDSVKKNQSLITLESEKASMEVPAEREGVVREVKVKVGDKVSQGSTIVSLTSRADSLRGRPYRPEPPPRAGSSTRATTVTAQAQPRATVHASPSIRRFARELGVDLAATARHRSKRTDYA